jgi:hypothetical protein
MKRIRHVLLGILVPGAMIAATVSGALGAPAAQAYGPNHVYQLTFSLNCDNKGSPICALPPDGFGLGGAWGWIEPDSDGTADATATFCAHSQGQNGAFHENLDGVPWTIVSAVDLPPGTFAVGTDPTGKYIVFPNSDLGFVAFPVTPGHYATTFGVPGITAQSTVTLMH